MSDIKTKRAISDDVAVLLEKYPKDHDTVVSFLLSYVGEGVAARAMRSAPQRSEKSSKNDSGKSPKDSSGKNHKGSSEKKAGERGNKSSSNIEEKPREEVTVDRGMVDLQTTGPGAPDILLCVLDESSQANRQEGACRPRMDKVSIGKRVKGARKALRKVLLTHKTPDITGYNVTCEFFITLINAVKHLRIVLRDATSANLSQVNLGVDLVDNWMSLTDYQSIILTVVNDGRFIIDDTTRFWTDPNGVGKKALSPGGKMEVANPYT